MPFGSSFNLGVTYHTLLGCILQRLDHFQPLFKTHLFNVICLQVAKFLQERKQTRSTSSPKERTTPFQLHVLYQVYCPLRDDLKPPKAFYQQQKKMRKNLSCIPYSPLSCKRSHSEFMRNPTSEVSKEKLEKHLSGLTEIQILYCGSILALHSKVLVAGVRQGWLL